MPTKNWWFKFDFKVWRTDTDLRRCSYETRGFWIDVLCVMHEMERSRLSGSFEELALVIGCSPELASRCILELKRTETADVFIGNGEVILTSRRMKRELKIRKQTQLRVKKHRECNADVTQSVTAQSKSKSNEKEKDKNSLSLAEQAVATYREFYPEAPLSLPLQLLIEDRVGNLIAWRKTLTYWQQNLYRALSVGKMLDCMDEAGYERNGNSKQQHGGSKRGAGGHHQSADDLAREFGIGV